jgi:hypothetical protein
MSRFKKNTGPSLMLQVIFSVEFPHRAKSVTGACPKLVIAGRRRVSSDFDDIWDEFGEPIADELAEKVRDAILTGCCPNKVYKFHFDGSIDCHATIEMISERERLVSYYRHEPSRAVRRRQLEFARANRRRRALAAPPAPPR